MEGYAEKEGRRLRRGYTTGTCAAAAACAAARFLLSRGQCSPHEVPILTPGGIEARIPVEELRREGSGIFCSVRKDSGDDPDVTDGALVCALVRKLADRPGTVVVEGGTGIGRVTKPGLACKVGEAAINPVPRRMIEEELHKAAEHFGYEGGLTAEISIPEGEALAEKTFNPKLGIIGGLSILGTSGIVEPMSEQALIDTVKLEINMKKAAGAEYLVLTPGNYGETFLKERGLAEKLHYVKCSNFIGEALSCAAERGFKGVLLVGHIGKLVKVAAGMMNTHSKYGDGRMETLAEHAVLAGASPETVRRLKACVTTEDAISVIKGYSPQAEAAIWQSLLARIRENMERWTEYRLDAEAMLYSNQYGYLAEKTAGVERFLLRACGEAPCKYKRRGR
ncbi:cobalt-precorrin-5B (C(1))-methyltransferase CbiD [Anaerovorax odorimutans]|uniref:Cobalt-precorrin-5B C(1)-methyltransferase n=1 Tax=Anaerovorax odorimutans TaxID=109327 RepID=A0ABT1RMG3_9FIRM|nr:cobalt-precorrin-5B (C(1))-methyltransferase CbiD [Anaerovorax odorimutans]MCQ4636380.1 cobalt-precorrin-5B (C(1))-methyltransferase CbiD [Anaerovorax odorimutans]